MPVHVNYHNKTLIIWVGEDKNEVVLTSVYDALLRFNEKTSVCFFKPPRGRNWSQIDVMSLNIIKKKKKKYDPVFSLKPIQNGTFKYNGNSIITSITLRGLTFSIRGTTTPNLVINSPDVLQALKYDIKQITLRSGKLVYARFQFVLDINGKSRVVIFEIVPPKIKYFVGESYSHIVEDYLEEYGVM